MKMQNGKLSQPVMIIGILVVFALIVITLLFKGDGIVGAKHDDHDHESDTEHNENEAAHEDEITLTAQQMIEQGIQLKSVELGQVEQILAYPAKLVVNTDQQAHVSSSFSGRVEHVNVELGQSVKKGQALATLLVPELVDQQANLQGALASLALAEQDYTRERQLWSQGISAKQDYQRAENTYRQAQITVQAIRARLNAFGASTNTHGRYILTAPITGVISQKDVVIGENIQLADQLFVIDQLNDLWLEFILPASNMTTFKPQQNVQFKSLNSGEIFEARIQNLTTEADMQTGRLQLRAKVSSQAQELRPNLLVNVLIPQSQQQSVLRIEKSAVQTFEGKNVVFIVESQTQQQIHLKPQEITIGNISNDGKWLEILSGLTINQSYVAQGSFLLKSELEKGEADHAH